MRAIRQHLQGVTWQRCQTHFKRNVLDATPKALKDKVYGRVRSLLDAPDVDTARLLLFQTFDAFEEKAPKAMQVLETGFDDTTAILSLPERYRKRLRITNSVERLNEEKLQTRTSDPQLPESSVCYPFARSLAHGTR